MENKKVRFSIVTIVLNDVKSIESTIKSCIDQTYVNKEYIIIDGLSTDGTLEVINKYNSCIDVFISEVDQGIYDAMNKGIRNCNGDYIIFMNSGDNFTNNNVLTKIYDQILKFSTKPELIYGDAYVFSLENKKQFYKKARSEKYYWYGMFTNHQSMLYGLDLIRNSNIYYDTSYSISADYKFTLEVLRKATSILYVPIAICKFSLDGISNQQKQCGLLEAEKARTEILNYGVLKNFFIRRLLYIARFFSEKLGFIYRFLRFS